VVHRSKGYEWRVSYLLYFQYGISHSYCMQDLSAEPWHFYNFLLRPLYHWLCRVSNSLRTHRVARRSSSAPQKKESPDTVSLCTNRSLPVYRIAVVSNTCQRRSPQDWINRGPQNHLQVKIFFPNIYHIRPSSKFQHEIMKYFTLCGSVLALVSFVLAQQQPCYNQADPDGYVAQSL
jgi:hypothetical protein